MPELTPFTLPPELNHPAWLHGLSAFTSVRLHWGAPQFWPMHRARLAATCALLGLSPPGELEIPPEAAAAEFTLLRLTVTDAGQFVSWRPLGSRASGGVHVHVGGQQVHPQWGAHKTGNYLPYVLALREARRVGAFEGLLTDGAGRVVDGSRSSLLIRSGGEILEPVGGLDGVTRSVFIQENAEHWRREALSLYDVQTAEALWLCGSGIGVRPVSQLSGDGWALNFEPEAVRSEQPGLVGLE
ncbi:aminotransferase class IV [Deinococcus sp.]|uniref:aminotransferase class IV n=1 Tax=Deinococcus sp. TaxID=47478 RepID=UPI0025E0A903|nr:aminotransferase class IV [Deinococcus sp.]